MSSVSSKGIKCKKISQPSKSEPTRIARGETSISPDDLGIKIVARSYSKSLFSSYVCPLYGTKENLISMYNGNNNNNNNKTITIDDIPYIHQQKHRPKKK